jgi:hypothetical protein
VIDSTGKIASMLSVDADAGAVASTEFVRCQNFAALSAALVHT